MNNNFQAYSSYYDLLYRDKDYAAEANYIATTLRKLNRNIIDILEYGCGTGGHAAFLCDKGFHVTGLERSADMVALASKKGIKHFEPLVGDITNFNLEKRFDAVSAFFHVISYLTTNKELVDCFINTNRHLKGDGYFVFDVWYAPAVYHQKPSSRMKRFEDDQTEVFRFAEPVWKQEANVVEVNYDIIVKNKTTLAAAQFSEKHPMRYFSIPEVRLLALQTGFEVMIAEEFLSGGTPGMDTWGVCFILKKVKDV